MTLRAPDSSWDYCVSAADQLMLWHGQSGHPHVVEEPLRTRVVVVLAACLVDRAVAMGLDPAIVDVPLAGALHILNRHPTSALEACRDTPAASATPVSPPASCGRRAREQSELTAYFAVIARSTSPPG